MKRQAPLFAALAVLVAAGGLVRADDRSARHPRRERADDPERALLSIDKEQQTLRAELDALTARESAAQRRMLLRGRAAYRLVRLGLLPVGGGFSSFLDHAFKIERARRALDQDIAEFRAAGDRKIAVGKKLDDLAARRSPLEVEREAAAQAHAVAADGEDRRRSFDSAFATSTGAGDYVAVYGGSLGGAAGPDSPAPSATDAFLAMKGRLPFPIAGRAEVRTVHRPGAPGPALEMAAPPGTAVRAVYPGRVAFADRYDPFGQLVILDHGGHYYTLMGDLATIDVRVGDDLSAGAKVGTVGASSSGESSGDDPTSSKPRKVRSYALYFELRRGTSALEPGPWLGL
jgi:septal ring factor EnvC (AmiA/AmiB activator)